MVKEFERLFESLFEDPKPFKDLIRIIARHRYGIGQSELIELSKLPDGGGTVNRLSQLEEAGFITSLVPYGHKDRGVYYVIDDEYSLFYLRWIEPIDQIRKALKIDPGATVGTWRFTPKVREPKEGAQIDLLFDRLDGAITLCEIKCSDRPFAIDKSYAQELLKKTEVFRKQTRTKKQIFFCMITTMGLKKTMYSEEIITNQATLEDLFKEI